MHDDSKPRRRLTDILAGDTDQIRDQWTRTEAAQDFAPLPSGTYEAHVQAAELFNAGTGTPGVKLTFRVAEGEHAGRFVWYDCWLTQAALPQTKRDCAKLGIAQLEQLENGAIQPGRIRCTVRVALRRDDDGEAYNRVRGFAVLRIDEAERDAFAPTDGADSADTSFDFGANAEPQGADHERH